MNRLPFKIIAICFFFAFVSCSKDGGEPSQSETTLTVADFSKTLDENPQKGTTIGTISASTNNGTLAFELLEQSPEGALYLDSSSGAVKVADDTLFDFETNPLITGTVKVINGEVSKTVLITITLNDLEEENIYEGDVVLKSQEEVNDFGANNYTKVTGSLTIGNPQAGAITDIIDFSPLQKLESISEDFWIINNPNLISTRGLNLHFVGKRLVITVNSSLEKVEGLDNITSVYDLALSENDNLYDVSGLSQLRTITNKIVLVSCPKITNVDWLSNLTTIGNQLFFDNLSSLTNIDGLGNLTTLNGEYIYFRITHNNSLTNLDGLRNLTADIYHLELVSNPSLTNIEGLQNVNVTTTLLIIDNLVLKNLKGLESVTNISHELSIKNNNLLFDLQGLNSLSYADYIQIYNNDSLKSLDGINNLLSIREFDIRGNTQLSDFCSLQNLFSIAPPLVYYAYYNAYNPTKQDIIDGNCSL